MDTPQITGEQLMAEGKFLSLKRLAWRDTHGVDRQWESAERVTFHGAVLIIPILRPSNRVALIRQYRPPARAFVVEFPAGLINPGETPEHAAARELREETGFVATSVRVYPPAYTTPGMADESVHMTVAEIDETRPENLHPKTEFDPSEMIETLFVPLAELPKFYQEQNNQGVAFDAKLAGFILAMDSSLHM